MPKTAVTKRTLRSTANVTFADTDTALDNQSAKKSRLELAIAAQSKDIIKHLQKVGRQSKAAADDIRNSGSIDGKVLQDFANDYQ